MSSAATNLCVLYLDFDGVLHPEDAFFHPARGAYLGPQSTAAGHKLFEHAQVLATALSPYPDVKIVLSTSWVQHRSYSKALRRLPVELQARVIGATFHAEHMSRATWFDLARGLQVLGDVGRRRPAHWVALDDDADDWPEQHLDKLVQTDAELGLARPGALDELRSHLESWAGNAIAPPERTTQDAIRDEEASKLILAQDTITGLTEALGGQFVSDAALDEALGVPPAPGRPSGGLTQAS